MLAVPGCTDSHRVPKPDAVVAAEKITARVRLDARKQRWPWRQATTEKCCRFGHPAIFAGEMDLKGQRGIVDKKLICLPWPFEGRQERGREARNEGDPTSCVDWFGGCNCCGLR